MPSELPRRLLQSLPLIKSGKLRPLGVSSPQRSPIAPELPSIAESGLKGFDMTNWYGLLVQGGTPREVISKLQQETARWADYYSPKFDRLEVANLVAYLNRDFHRMPEQ